MFPTVAWGPPQLLQLRRPHATVGNNYIRGQLVLGDACHPFIWEVEPLQRTPTTGADPDAQTQATCNLEVASLLSDVVRIEREHCSCTKGTHLCENRAGRMQCMTRILTSARELITGSYENTHSSLDASVPFPGAHRNEHSPSGGHQVKQHTGFLRHLNDASLRSYQKIQGLSLIHI